MTKKEILSRDEMRGRIKKKRKFENKNM